MKIYIGTDHRGAEIRSELILALNALGYTDIFTSTLPNSSEDDYVDFAIDVCEKMNVNTDIGILICGNGIGMSIIANKVEGIRCARVVNEDDATKAKEHNGANVLALGSDLGIAKIVSIVDTFIKTKASEEERHQRRVNKIINYEEGTYNEL